jgi:hypothetical protein
MPKAKRARLSKPKCPSHCPWCGQDMSIPACCIDWETVWFEIYEKKEKEKFGRKLNEEEIEKLRFDLNGDPCDDCCCGGCGARKDYPGQCHC